MATTETGIKYVFESTQAFAEINKLVDALNRLQSVEKTLASSNSGKAYTAATASAEKYTAAVEKLGSTGSSTNQTLSNAIKVVSSEQQRATAASERQAQAQARLNTVTAQLAVQYDKLKQAQDKIASSPAPDALNRLNAAAASANERILALTSQQNALQSELGQTASAADATGNALKNTPSQISELGDSAQNIGGASSSLDQMAGSINNIISLAGGLAVVKVAFDGIALAVQLADEGAQINRISDSFERLGGTSAYLEQLRVASRGTATDLQLMEQTVKLLMGTSGELQSALQSAAPNLLAIAAAANQINPSLGTTEQLYANLVDGIKKGSVEVLDNLGIVVNSGAAYEQYAAKIGVSSDSLTKQQQILALLTAVQAQGNTLIEQAGDAADDATAKINTLTTAWANYVDATKAAFAANFEGEGAFAGTAENIAQSFDIATQKITAARDAVELGFDKFAVQSAINLTINTDDIEQAKEGFAELDSILRGLASSGIDLSALTDFDIYLITRYNDILKTGASTYQEYASAALQSSVAVGALNTIQADSLQNKIKNNELNGLEAASLGILTQAQYDNAAALAERAAQGNALIEQQKQQTQVDEAAAQAETQAAYEAASETVQAYTASLAGLSDEQISQLQATNNLKRAQEALTAAQAEMATAIAGGAPLSDAQKGRLLELQTAVKDAETAFSGLKTAAQTAVEESNKELEKLGKDVRVKISAAFDKSGVDDALAEFDAAVRAAQTSGGFVTVDVTTQAKIDSQEFLDQLKSEIDAASEGGEIEQTFDAKLTVSNETTEQFGTVLASVYDPAYYQSKIDAAKEKLITSLQNGIRDAVLAAAAAQAASGQITAEQNLGIQIALGEITVEQAQLIALAQQVQDLVGTFFSTIEIDGAQVNVGSMILNSDPSVVQSITSQLQAVVEQAGGAEAAEKVLDIVTKLNVTGEISDADFGTVIDNALKSVTTGTDAETAVKIALKPELAQIPDLQAQLDALIAAGDENTAPAIKIRAQLEELGALQTQVDALLTSTAPPVLNVSAKPAVDPASVELFNADMANVKTTAETSTKPQILTVTGDISDAMNKLAQIQNYKIADKTLIVTADISNALEQLEYLASVTIGGVNIPVTLPAQQAAGGAYDLTRSTVFEAGEAGREIAAFIPLTRRSRAEQVVSQLFGTLRTHNLLPEYTPQIVHNTPASTVNNRSVTIENVSVVVQTPLAPPLDESELVALVETSVQRGVKRAIKNIV